MNMQKAAQQTENQPGNRTQVTTSEALGPTGVSTAQRALQILQNAAGNQAVTHLLRTTHPVIQTKSLTVGAPGDPYEREADRVADAVVSRPARQPGPVIASSVGPALQREEKAASKPKSEGEKYKEAAKKVGEAFLETPVGKQITDKALELGESFISTLPGQIITGTAAAGALSTLIATNKALPVQLPAIPLDKLFPGLKMKITYEGPVRQPTNVAISFSFTFNKSDKKSTKKTGMSETDKMRAETARMAADQAKFRQSLQPAAERAAEDKAFWDTYWRMKLADPRNPLRIPGLKPKSEAPPSAKKAEEEEQGTVQRQATHGAATPAVAPPIVDEVLRSPGQPLDPATRATMEPAFGHDFSQVRVHTDGQAAESAQTLNANAYTAGPNVVFGQGQFAPNTRAGQHLLAHELAHVVQQSAALAASLPSNAERDADHMAEGALVGRASPPQAKSSLPWLRKAKSLAKGEIVVAMRVAKNPPGSKSPSTVQVTTSLGQTFSYEASQDNVPIGPHTGKKAGNGLQIDVAGSGYVLYFVSNRDSPPPGSLVFSATFPIEVVSAKSAAPLGGGTGDKAGDSKGSGNGTGNAQGAGQGQGSASGDKPAGKISADKRAADKAGGGQGSKDGVKNGVKGGAKDGVQGGGKDGGNQPIPDAVTEVPKDFKGPVVQVSDPADVEKLKKMGLIPAKTADEIKAKLDKGETLNLAEVMALMEGLNAVTEPPAKESGPGKESWLKWARFVQENKDKISGKTKTGDKGMTVDEVKEIIAKYKEFVGVKDAPKGEGDKKDFNPEKRKSWNALQPWEKELWKEYLKRHPGDQGVSEDTDLRITDGMKMIMALRASPAYVRGGGREALIQMVNDPIFIGGTMVGITLYVAAWLAPEPIFSKATAATITTALLTLFTVSEIKNFAVAWMNLSDESAKAKNIDDIETAAEHFGKAMGGILARVLVTLATFIAGKALPGPPAVKGPGGGGGMGMGAVAGGPKGMTMPIPQAVPVNGIKVLADGTVVVITNVGVMATAAKGGSGGSSSGGGSTGGGSEEPQGNSGKETKPKKEFTPEEKAASKQLEQKMAAEKEAAAMKKLAKEAPDLHKEVASNQTTMADGKTTLKDLAQENPQLLKEMYAKWKQGVAKGEIKSKDFGKYVRSRQSEFRGRSGELEDAFKRGPNEIIVKAPKAKVTEPGSDAISYDTVSDRIKYLDNKAVKTGATVSKVSAAEKNLPKNLADDIADIKKFAGKPGVPKEIGDKVLPRLEAAKAEIDAYILKNKLTPDQLKSTAVQKDFAKILDKHGIDRVVTFGGAGKNTGISGKLAGDKGFKTE